MDEYKEKAKEGAEKLAIEARELRDAFMRAGFEERDAISFTFVMLTRGNK